MKRNFVALASVLVLAIFIPVGASASMGVGSAAARGRQVERFPGLARAVVQPYVYVPDALRIPSATLRTFRASAWGGQYTTNTGETITLYNSSYYPHNANNIAFLQSMANWMADILPHGSEFSRLTVGFAPPFEIGSLCGSPDAIGCYNPAAQFMFVPGNDLPDGTNKETVLVHEYGHHIANNRDNAPWDALEWGPKYWAPT
jgi:hypothetical protein